MVHPTKRRFFVASVAAAGAFLAVALIVGLVDSWFEMPYTNPDGTPDNAPIRAAGILLMLSPVLFILLTALTFFSALLLRGIGRLTPRALITVVVLASISAAFLMAVGRPFGWRDMLYYFLGFAAIIFVPSSSAAWVWWKVAMRPNNTVERDGPQAARPSP
jgi:hypothetical protein